jgi:hypothetical protein
MSKFSVELCVEKMMDDDESLTKCYSRIWNQGGSYGGGFGMYGRTRERDTSFWCRTEHLENLATEGRIILKWIFKT